MKKLSLERKIVLVIETLRRSVNGEASQIEIEEALNLLSSITLGDLN